MEMLVLDGEIPVNAYIIRNGNQCFVIDPGYQKARLQAYMHEHQLEVVGILLTHAHIDHVEALDAFAVPIYLHEAEAPILHDNVNNGFTFYGKTQTYQVADLDIHYIQDGWEYPFGAHCIRALWTPGHTPGSVCYEYGAELYSGDTLFAGTVGRWDFPLGNLATLQKTIVTLLEQQPENQVVYPAHGPATTIGTERQNNPYYWQWRSLVHALLGT